MIVNLTQHAPTPEQEAAGVGPLSAEVARLLTFDAIPTAQEVRDKAAALAAIAAPACGLHRPRPGFPARVHEECSVCEEDPHTAMIGGAPPYLMPALERALIAAGITPVYAFSLRESVDQPQPDGSVRKVNVFRHAGFVTGTVYRSVWMRMRMSVR